MTSRAEDVERLQTKIRRVRTAEGAELYGTPIGTPIRPHSSAAKLPRSRRNRAGLIHPGHDPGAEPAPRPPERPRTPAARAPRTPAARPVVPTTTDAIQKVDKRRTGGQTKSNFIHPDTGAVMGKTETGDTFEQLFKAKMQANLEDKFGCCLKLITGAGEGTNRTTPLDFQVGDRGGEVKSLNARAKNQKTAIKKAEVARKVNACSASKLKALLVVQVIDQDGGVVSVYGYPAFASKAVSTMTLLGEYHFDDKDFQSAQEASGHWDKRHARLAAQQKKAAETKAIGEVYNPPDEMGGVIEAGDTVIELRPVRGRPVPFIWTEGEDGEEGEGGDDEVKTVAVRHVRTPEGSRRYNLPIGSPIAPIPDVPVPPYHPMLSAQDLLGLASPRLGWTVMDRPSNAPGIETFDENAQIVYRGKVVAFPEGRGWRWSVQGHALRDRRQFHHSDVADTPEDAIYSVEKHLRDETRHEYVASQVEESRPNVDDDLAAADATLQRQETIADRIPALDLSDLDETMTLLGLPPQAEPRQAETPEHWTAGRLALLSSAAYPWQLIPPQRPEDTSNRLWVEHNTPNASQQATVHYENGKWIWHVTGYARQSERSWSKKGFGVDARSAVLQAERYMDSAEVPTAPPSHTSEQLLALVADIADHERSQGHEPFRWRPIGEHGIQVNRTTDFTNLAGRVEAAPNHYWTWRVRGSVSVGEDTVRGIERTGKEGSPQLAISAAQQAMTEADQNEARNRAPIPDDHSFWHFVTRVANDWGDEVKELHPEARKRLNAVYGGTFGGLSVTVRSAAFRYGDLDIKGDISDSLGNDVGEWTVSVEDRGNDADHPRLRADHGLLQLQEHVQAAGFATEWRLHLMQAYLRGDVREVTNHADISVGGYSWAKAGFGWDPEDGKPGNVMRRLDRAFGLQPTITSRYNTETQDYEDIETPGSARLSGFSPATRDAAMDIWQRMNDLPMDDPRYPTPQDIAVLGLADKYERRRDSNPMGNGGAYDGKVMTSWPGKDILLGSDWHALARLG